MTANVVAHPWSPDAIFAKAVLYAERMESHSANDELFGFWSALVLEFLARAALATISPVLLASETNWRNAAYAVGLSTTKKGFSPFSASSKDVLLRLSETLPSFTAEHVSFCTTHLDRRNSELHTGELVFSSLGTSQWLPHFYKVSKVLLLSMCKDLSSLFSDTAAVEGMISALDDAAAKAVLQDVSAHKLVWLTRLEEERTKAAAQASVLADRQIGHRVKCPSCESTALLQGNPVGPVTTEVDDYEVIQKQKVVPGLFACSACGLRIIGYSKLMACGLADSYTATTTSSAADFFGLYSESDLERAREEGPSEQDFNEY